MSEQEKKKKTGISRREFLKDAGIVVGGVAATTLVACGDGTTGTGTENKNSHQYGHQDSRSGWTNGYGHQRSTGTVKGANRKP